MTYKKPSADLWKQAQLGEKPKYLWEDAVVRWIQETSHKATQHDDLMHLRWLDIYLRDRKLDSITRDDIDLITQSRIKEGVWATGKQDVTRQAIAAVANHLLKNGCSVLLADESGEPGYEITISKINDTKN